MILKYLKQTKKQAENAIDVLNTKINELVEENDNNRIIISELEKERDYYRDYCQQLGKLK